MKKLLIMALGCVVAAGACAESQPIQFSLTPDIAMHPRETQIKGASIGIWNENPAGTQWQFGFVNGTSGDSVGIQGLPFFVGIPSFYNYAENYKGAQLGIVNYASGDFTGLQWGVVNYASTLTGAQIGIVNLTETTTAGFQLGIVNHVRNGNKLLQIGIVNIIEDNESFNNFPNDLSKGMVIVNWSFGE